MEHLSAQVGVWEVAWMPEVGGGPGRFPVRGGAASGVSTQQAGRRTLVRTEAPLAVIVIVGCGRAPHLPIAAARARAALVLVAQEGEGEDAGGTLRVPANSGHGCGVRDMAVESGGRKAPEATTGEPHEVDVNKSRLRSPRFGPGHWSKHFSTALCSGNREVSHFTDGKLELRETKKLA